ncbi:MAG: hypothetical protein J5944_02720 [Lentisphaeria bacterium]|nr:hypothetical protein [Lentisphaeria bacterium]
MIELSENTILILDPEGRTAPFDPELLRVRLADALSVSGLPDPSLASDIALAVDFALRERLRSLPGILRSADVEILAGRILSDLGLEGAVRAFRRTAPAGTVSFVVEIQRIRDFLESQFPGSGVDLDRAAKKVFHTLQSIGAEAAKPALVTELARHFLLSSQEKGGKALPDPVFARIPSPCTLSPDEILRHLQDPDARKAVRERIVSIRAIDLRIFPVLRFDLRLTGLADGLPEGPLTELSLAPALYRTADIMDALALAADAACSAVGHETDTPLKTALHLGDASVFTHDFMGCVSEKEIQACAASLAGILRSALARVPIRVTCQ